MDLNKLYINQYATTFDEKKSSYFPLDYLLTSKIGKDISIFILKPSEIVFDKRTLYCCKLKCPNYDTRCFCPPHSLKLQIKCTNKKWVIIFAKTYDFTELKHFKENPQNLNEIYLKKKRVFVRRWVQNDFYSKIKQIFRMWRYNNNDIFSGGFSNKKCKKCYSSHYKDKKILDTCLPMPAPEALGIDVKKSLEKCGYFFKFGVEKRMTKIAMIFTNKNLIKYQNYKKFGEKDNRFEIPYYYNEKKLLDDLKNNFPTIDFFYAKKDKIERKLKQEYRWLNSWNKIIVWKNLQKINENKMKKEIHHFIFMKNNYFALDFFIYDIFKEKNEYVGIHFF